ncbi:MAG: hypothetical protein U5J83_18260 [Bryobacterales bacterium]|nr:hypothetical protein [Bryobacterales bacterium]
MRFQAIFAALLVLATGTLRFCPSCDSAEAQQAAAHPQGIHDCCKRTGEAPPAPSHSPDEAPAGDQCTHQQIARILQSAVPETAVVVDATPAVLPSLSLFELAAVPAQQPDAAVALNPSPPPLLSLPIRI